jgi:hypothetical protein
VIKLGECHVGFFYYCEPCLANRPVGKTKEEAEELWEKEYRRMKDED